MLDSFMEFSRLRFLRKLSIGGWAVLEWRTFTFRRDLATRLFTEITSLEWLSLGLELWDRESRHHIALNSSPHEWKDKGWWE